MRSLKLLFLILLMVGSLKAVTLTTQSFNNSTIPAGWHIAGTENPDSNLTAEGTAKTLDDFFYYYDEAEEITKPLGYLRLTDYDSDYDRAWAYYTANTFNLKGRWQVEITFRIGDPSPNPLKNDGGDGLTLAFVDASTVQTGGVFDPAKVEGGYGTFLGAPHGINEGWQIKGSQGYIEGLKGFAFAFDHYDSSSDYNEEEHNTLPQSETLKWMKLDDWTVSGYDYSTLSDQTFYYNNGPITVRLVGDNGQITCSYGTNFANSQTFNIDAMTPDFDAYLGITASTGGSYSYHEVSYVKLDDNDPTLPVTLDSFNGCVANGNQINLQWITQTETNVSGYQIYRNTEPDLENALQLDTFIPATNSSQTQAYIFSDTELVEDGTYYYWLQNLDMDGSSEYHGPVQVVLNTSSYNLTPPSQFQTGIKRAYPNPFNPDITISYELDRAGFTELKIYNLRGQVVRDLYQGSQNRGSHSVLWNGRDDQNNTCSSGTYILVLKAGTQTFNHRLILSK